MDGLECSEIKKSELEYSGRIDSEYYQKKYLFYQALVEKCQNSTLGKTSTFLIGPFGSAYSTENYVANPDYRYVRGQDVKPFFLKSDEARYMAEDDFHRLEKYALKQDDILVSVVGTLGNACIVQSKDVPGIFSCKSTVVRTSSINPYFLLSYLNSKIGRDLLLRKERGAIQKGLNLGDLDSLLVPVFSSRFQQEIEEIIKQALVNIAQAQTAYKEAEKILYIKLQMRPSTTIENTVSIKSLSDSFTITGRLDAEYYQPKYEELFATLSKQTTRPLGGKDGIVTIKKSIEPGSDAYCDEGIPFVRVSDVTKFGISDPSIKLPSDIVSDVTVLYPHENTILFSKDGSVGIAYKVEKNLSIITSGALLHLTVKNPDEVLSDYLTLVLNSKIVQLQAERDSSGAIIQHWKPSEIEKVIIPVLDIETQQQISNKVKESFALRHQSEQLLECAKQVVEIAIEEGEEKAMEWLKEKGVEADVKL